MPGYDNSVLDAALDTIATATALHICSVPLPPARPSSPRPWPPRASPAPAHFTTADGDTDGRKVTVAAKSGLAVTASGTPSRYCLVDVFHPPRVGRRRRRLPRPDERVHHRRARREFELGDPTWV